jgi:hypothetical protein
MLSHETIKQVAELHGYRMDNEACMNIIEGSYEGETIGRALVNCLSAYEGLTAFRCNAILNDKEAGLTK